MWRGDRKLAFTQSDSQVVQYYHNHEGLRVRKIVDNVPTDYTLSGVQITHMTHGNEWMHFYYDGQGRPAIVNYNGSTYHYLYDLQGDVIGVVDSSGSLVVEYKYDAWGKPLGKSGTLATTLGTLNPFRYRGYVYDEETGLYYLRSRYYNPEWGRFISADALLGETGALFSHNLFCYCGNNPVVSIDENGGKATNFLNLDFNWSRTCEDYKNAAAALWKDIKAFFGCFEVEVGGGLGIGNKMKFNVRGTEMGFSYYGGIDFINIRLDDNSFNTGYAYIGDASLEMPFIAIGVSGRIHGKGHIIERELKKHSLLLQATYS